MGLFNIKDAAPAVLLNEWKVVTNPAPRTGIMKQKGGRETAIQWCGKLLEAAKLPRLAKLLAERRITRRIASTFDLVAIHHR